MGSLSCTESRVRCLSSPDILALSLSQHPTTTMADIASQLVLHPTLSLALRYGGSTLGRDKARCYVAADTSLTRL